MKKVLRIVLSSCALFALISCVNEKASSVSSKTTSEPPSSESSPLPSSLSSSEESSIPVSSSSSSSVKPSSSSSVSSSIVVSSSIGPSSEPSSSIPSSSIEPSSSSSAPTDIYYHVVFQNYDETVLDEVDVLEGNEAIYSGETPTKEADDEFTYEFIGWDKDLKNIHSDVTTKALFKEVPKENWGPINWLLFVINN